MVNVYQIAYHTRVIEVLSILLRDVGAAYILLPTINGLSKGVAMGIISWIIIGGLAGWIASKVMNTDREQGFFANILVGVIGAMIGGWLWSILGGDGQLGFNVASLLIAIGGSIVLLYFYRLISSRG